MTQSTKLEIIGPYTPEHEGPFCTRDGRPARILCADMKNKYSIVAIVAEKGGTETVSTFLEDGRFGAELENPERDLMNAREVPVAREFWINEYTGVVPANAVAHRHEKDARAFENDPSFIRTIHVREVLPGESIP